MRIIIVSSLLFSFSLKAMDELPVKSGAVKVDTVPKRFRSSRELGLKWDDGSKELEKQNEIKKKWERIAIKVVEQERTNKKEIDRVPTPHPDQKNKQKKLSYAGVVAGKKDFISEEQQAVEVELQVMKKKKQTRWERREKEAQQRAIVARRKGYSVLD